MKCFQTISTCALALLWLATANVACSSDSTEPAAGTSGAGGTGGSGGTSGAGGSSVAVGKPMQVAAGTKHTCSLSDTGVVFCWGASWLNGTKKDNSSPVLVPDLTGVRAISANNRSTCALLESGSVRCWGGNESGQLGDGTTTNSYVPVTVSGLTTATAVAVGSNFACALLADKTIQCWGRNTDGQLGNGTNTESNVPVPVSNLESVISLYVGSTKACALRDNGTVYCWGANQDWTGANPDSNTKSNVPISLTEVKDIQTMSISSGHTCVLNIANDGEVRCWGSNKYGELGDGTTTNYKGKTLVTALNLQGVSSISAGGANTCALMKDSTVKCWGYNMEGQLGNGSTTDSLVPVAVSGLSDVVAINGGDYSHYCAVTKDNSVYCWGYNSNGQLGVGSLMDSNVPVLVQYPQ
jgi:alpha-tubulin suppressor-like RCC1 family protein